MSDELIGIITSEGEITGTVEDNELNINVTIVGTGEQGETGKSAYQEWLDLGNIGSEEDFILSLKGKAGYTPQKDIDYFDGIDGYTPQKDIDYFDGSDGEQGLSAYEVWLSEGNIGTVEDYLNSLKGSDAEVTNANVINALGYTPANEENEHIHENKNILDLLEYVNENLFFDGKEVGGKVPNLTQSKLELGAGTTSNNFISVNVNATDPSWEQVLKIHNSQVAESNYQYAGFDFSIGKGNQFSTGHLIFSALTTGNVRHPVFRVSRSSAVPTMSILSNFGLANNKDIVTGSTDTGATVSVFKFGSDNQLHIGPRYSANSTYGTVFWVDGVTANFDWKKHSNVQLMRLTGVGDLGIGTTTPTEKLDVVGNVNATGYKVDGVEGATGEFQSADGKTITVTNGLITSII